MRAMTDKRQKMIYRTGNLIKDFRLNNHWSQIELAEKVGCSNTAIRNYEKHRQLPDAEILHELAKCFHMTMEEMIV